MRLFVLAVAGLVFAGACSARFCVTLPPNPDDGKEFVDRFTTALTYFQDAEAKHRTIGNSKDAAEFVSALKFAQEDFSCAAKTIDGFATSKSQGIQTAVMGIQAAATELSQLNEVAISDFVAELNGDRKNVPPGDRAERMASIQQQSRAAWQLLTQAATAASLGLVEFDPANNQMKRLVLSSGERQKAMSRLRGLYPRLEKAANNTPPVETAAGVLYDFLRSKRWRSHDQPFGGP